MKAIITVGISASGKTTWANEYLSTNPGCHNVNRDDIRAEIMIESGLRPVWSNWKWKWEGKVTDRADAAIEAAAAEGADLIVSDTNLNPGRFDSLAEKLTNMGYEVSVKVFEVSFDEAVRRDNERANGVGYSVIQKQYQQFLDLKAARVIFDTSKTKAVIVDIDGTVALMNGGRGPFEWDRVDQDAPNQPVIEMVKGLAAAGHFILFTSGRDAICFERTERWLGVQFPGWQRNHEYSLLMRPVGDVRKDTVIKEEIFRKYIEKNFNVVVVLDDRPSVCRMWRDLGLNVVQVGNPYIEF